MSVFSADTGTGNSSVLNNGSGKGSFWNTSAGNSIISGGFGLLSSIFGGGRSNDGGNGTPTIIYQNSPSGATQPKTDYGKYIVWGVIGLVFFSVLFMGFSMFMNRGRR